MFGFNTAQPTDKLSPFTDTGLVAAPARVLSIAACANTKSLHALWPIRAPTFQLRQSGRESCRHALAAKGEFWHTSARHAYTRTLHATSRPRLYFSNISFRPHYCVFGQRAILSLGSTASHYNCLACWYTVDLNQHNFTSTVYICNMLYCAAALTDHK